MKFLRENKIPVFFCAGLLLFFIYVFNNSDIWKVEDKPFGVDDASAFVYTFNTNERLFETGTMEESSSPYWWVDSGAFLDIGGGVGKTVQGSLPSDDAWRIEYEKTNPVDTDGGFHPQNIFRLVTKSQWLNPRQEVYFKINQYNLSNSQNRGESNGLLLFSHYVDSENLYYAGLRVDGTAVIKKKFHGTYYILDQEKVFAGSYDRNQNPNLLPKNVWIGERSEVVFLSDGKVQINLYGDLEGAGNWRLLASAVDNDTKNTLSEKSSAGIRTDFFDVEFRDYKVEEIK